MTARPCNVLFLCTKNSARSIMAEVLLRHYGGARFQAFSAGSMPLGVVHPLTVKLLRQYNLDSPELRSKSWEEYARPGAPEIDIVITVCNRAANETCPIFPGAPVQAHWAIENPDVRGLPDALLWQRFQRAWRELDERIHALVALPVAELTPELLRKDLEMIGRLQSSCPELAEAG
jgi:protein-tyrosine-phosphatase